MKKKLIVGMLILIILLTSTFLFIKSSYGKVVQSPFKFNAETINLKVANGDSLNNILSKLKQQDLIRSSYLIKYYMKSNNIDVTIKPGLYVINKDMTLEKFLHNLNNGVFDENSIKVTIPEGFNIEQIAGRLEEKQVVKKEDFLKALQEYILPSYIKKNSGRKYALEGFLFPDTYNFRKDITAKEVIDEMLERFEFVVRDIEKGTGKTIEEKKLDDLITMASIVEREVEKNEERGKAASVFYNRMNINMKLESCATVLYSLGYHKEELSLNDLKVNSPFNTYKVTALPVGPICSPSRASIEAALNPPKTDYLYFILNDDGTHFFTKDYKEFEKKKAIRDGKK